VLAAGVSLCAQNSATTKALDSTPHHDAKQLVFGSNLTPMTELFADVRAHLTVANAAQRGELWLEVSATNSATPAQITLRIPLANTGDVYGESRSCTTLPDGTDQLIFTAGMDENNFVDFSPAERDASFHLLLNKYLCRVLAAPFHCGTRTVSLPSDWSNWRLGGSGALLLSGDAPAKLSVSSASVTPHSTAFAADRCAVVAPSNGICCVAHKTTEWHCGGTPVGEGWHQVSGECFHRETGGSCSN
jgi:hypothetical protein